LKHVDRPLPLFVGFGSVTVAAITVRGSFTPQHLTQSRDWRQYLRGDAFIL
jgi:hypothetical protein